ncbi:GPI ethanolamine phosphate transferase, stabilizing subunit isoform X5 [Pteropus medius]|uniref:phosphatidylinositol-glycan biosynthesis class F protein isoform X5 n=1 Tax=Pteropus vampyrus TaxID=132908 RepID=UPI00196AD9EE|nr:phosphatidylinositol-glycan biosynthesis class F protein isoform X5 [Pteropus giganteus]
MRPLNSHFSHTILPRRFPTPRSGGALKTLILSQGKIPLPGYKNPLPAPPRSAPPILHLESRKKNKHEREGGATSFARPSAAAVGCAALGVRPTGVRLREDLGGAEHLMVGGNSSLFPSAGGRTRLTSIWENSLQITTISSFIGTWLGAFPIPLDWERPWQVWPISCTLGATFGYVAGLVISPLWIYWNRKQLTYKNN